MLWLNSVVMRTYVMNWFETDWLYALTIADWQNITIGDVMLGEGYTISTFVITAAKGRYGFI